MADREALKSDRSDSAMNCNKFVRTTCVVLNNRSYPIDQLDIGLTKHPVGVSLQDFPKPVPICEHRTSCDGVLYAAGWGLRYPFRWGNESSGVERLDIVYGTSMLSRPLMIVDPAVVKPELEHQFSKDICRRIDHTHETFPARFHRQRMWSVALSEANASVAPG